MKAGLAAAIAAMESYRGDASLLFLAVADEEDRSAGARAAAPLMAAAAICGVLRLQTNAAARVV